MFQKIIAGSFAKKITVNVLLDNLNNEKIEFYYISICISFGFARHLLTGSIVKLLHRSHDDTMLNLVCSYSSNR
jgi:hypothetical protein